MLHLDVKLTLVFGVIQIGNVLDTLQTIDENPVVYNSFGWGVTNKNLEGYIKATMGQLGPNDLYYYSTKTTPDGAKIQIKNKQFTKNSDGIAINPCSKTDEEGNYVNACSDEGVGPTQRPDKPTIDDDPLVCQCGAPISPDNLISGTCLSPENGKFHACTLEYRGGKYIGVDTIKCGTGKCVPRYSRLCQSNLGYTSAISSCNND